MSAGRGPYNQRRRAVFRPTRMTEAQMKPEAPAPSEKNLWRLVGYSALLGVIGAASGMIFLGVTGIGERWYGTTGYGWFEGHWWWIAVAAAAGLVVGLLRRYLKVEDEIPGLIEDLQDERVDPKPVPGIVAVSAVSLIGGASLGPEVALGQIGGGSAGLIANREKYGEDTSKALALAGMAGAFGGLFSSPLVSMMLVLEVGRPAVRRLQRAFYASLISSSVAFGIYMAIVGSVFLGIYEVPAFTYDDWHLLAAVGFGVLAAIIALVVGIVGQVAQKAFSSLPGPALIKPVVGGVIFGLVGFALPLTNFTGSEQLNSVLESSTILGAGLVAAIIVAKILAFAASNASGFIGGPIFPVLFIGGTCGVLINQLIPGIPLGLAFACMLAAVAGAIVSAPFSMVLLAALFTQIGALETAPILIAVGVSYITLSSIRMAIGHRKGGGSGDSPPTQTPTNAEPGAA